MGVYHLVFFNKEKRNVGAYLVEGDYTELYGITLILLLNAIDMYLPFHRRIVRVLMVNLVLS